MPVGSGDYWLLIGMWLWMPLLCASYDAGDARRLTVNNELNQDRSRMMMQFFYRSGRRFNKTPGVVMDVITSW